MIVFGFNFVGAALAAAVFLKEKEHNSYKFQEIRLTQSTLLFAVSFTLSTSCDMGSPGSSVGRLVTGRLQARRPIRDWKVQVRLFHYFSTLCAVPVYRKKHKTEAPSQSPEGAGSLN